MRKGKKIFYVDLPDPDSTEIDNSWVNITVCFSRKEAIRLLEDKWGIDKKYSELFISEGREM